MICYTVSYVWGMHCLNDGAEMREERFLVGVNRMDRVRHEQMRATAMTGRIQS